MTTTFNRDIEIQIDGQRFRPSGVVMPGPGSRKYLELCGRCAHCGAQFTQLVAGSSLMTFSVARRCKACRKPWELVSTIHPLAKSRPAPAPRVLHTFAPGARDGAHQPGTPDPAGQELQLSDVVIRPHANPVVTLREFLELIQAGWPKISGIQAKFGCARRFANRATLAASSAGFLEKLPGAGHNRGYRLSRKAQDALIAAKVEASHGK